MSAAALVADAEESLGTRVFRGAGAVATRMGTAVAERLEQNAANQKIFDVIKGETGARGVNGAVLRAYQHGRRVLAAHGGAGTLSDGNLVEIATRHAANDAHFAAMKKQAAGSLLGNVTKAGGLGLAAGLVAGAVTLPLKLALGAADLAVRAVTLNKVKSNMRNAIGMWNVAKWSAIGTSVIAGTHKVTQMPARSEALEKAYLMGLRHENAARAPIAAAAKTPSVPVAPQQAVAKQPSPSAAKPAPEAPRQAYSANLGPIPARMAESNYYAPAGSVKGGKGLSVASEGMATQTPPSAAKAVPDDPYANVPKGVKDTPEQRGTANYHAVRDAVEQGQNPLSIILAANDDKFNPQGKKAVSGGQPVDASQPLKPNVEPDDKGRGAAR